MISTLIVVDLSSITMSATTVTSAGLDLLSTLAVVSGTTVITAGDDFALVGIWKRACFLGRKGLLRRLAQRQRIFYRTYQGMELQSLAI